MKDKLDWQKVGPLAAGSFLLLLVVAVAGIGRLRIDDPWAKDAQEFKASAISPDCTPEVIQKLGFDDKARLARTSLERAKLLKQDLMALPPEEAKAKGTEVESILLCSDNAFDAALRDAPAFGPKDKRYTDLLNEVAYYNLYDRNRLDRAITLFTQLSQVREAGAGPSSPDLALDLNKLGNVYAYAGRAPEAEKAFRRALDIVTANPSSLDATNTVKRDFSVFLDRLGRKPEAEQILAK